MRVVGFQTRQQKKAKGKEKKTARTTRLVQTEEVLGSDKKAAKEAAKRSARLGQTKAGYVRLGSPKAVSGLEEIV